MTIHLREIQDAKKALDDAVKLTGGNRKTAEVLALQLEHEWRRDWRLGT